MLEKINNLNLKDMIIEYIDKKCDINENLKNEIVEEILELLSEYEIGHIKTSKNNPSDLNIDCGTDKTLVLTESVWDDIIISPSNLRGGVSVPNFYEFQNGVYQFLFINGQ
jgi:hypothetical protein